MGVSCPSGIDMIQIITTSRGISWICPTSALRLSSRPATGCWRFCCGGRPLAGPDRGSNRPAGIPSRPSTPARQTQQLQDDWSEEKADLVRRFRAATGNVRWLTERKAEETAEADALDDRVAELERRLGEADRLEGSMQDTLMVIFHRLDESVAAEPALPARGTPAAAGRGQGRTGAAGRDLGGKTAPPAGGPAGRGGICLQRGGLPGRDRPWTARRFHADILRLGRVALFWRTPDGDRVGSFDRRPACGSNCRAATSGASPWPWRWPTRMRPVELIDLPLGRIAP